jgi:organic radical activating enzyme
MRVNISNVDYHVIDACNLACDFCSHYSNFKGPAKLVSVDQAEKEWNVWSKKICPAVFNVIGGEPTLNPELPELIKLASRIWHHSEIHLYTNGANLHRLPELRTAMRYHHVQLGLHLSESENKQIVEKVRKFFFGYNVNIHIVPINYQFIPFYRMVDGVPTPYEDNNQRSSWLNCVAAKYRCFVLKDNLLWKCAQIAFADRAGIQDWFKEYDPCPIDGDISSWALREDESCCLRCPANPQPVKHNETTQRVMLPVLT